MLLFCGVFWSGRASAQTNSPWQAVDVAIGGNSKPRLLWTHPDGRAVLWTNGGGYIKEGPYPSWTARTVAAGPDGKAVVLWTNTSGMISLHRISINGAVVEATRDYGPFSDGGGLDWQAVSLAVDALNQPRVVWKRTDGKASIWQVDGALNLLSQSSFGPYSGWSPDKIGFDSANTARLIWNNSDGRTDLWSLDANMVRANIVSYGPYAGWSPYTLAVAQDGTGWLGWKFTDGRVDLWHLDGAGNRVDIKSYGPYVGWQSRGIAVYPGPDNRVRALWQYQNGGIHLWNLSATGDRDSAPIDVYNFPPTNPTATSVTSSTGVPQIQVAADIDDTSATYEVFRSLSSSGPFDYVGVFGLVNKLGTRRNYYSDQNIVPGTTYYYRVERFTAGILSGDIATVNAVAPAAPPPTPAPTSAPTVIFNEEFDNSTHWTGSGSQYDGTNWTQYKPDFFYLEDKTDWGKAPEARFNTNEGALDNKYIRLKVSTYDAAHPGRYAQGTELQCLTQIQPPAVGQAIEFETRLRVPQFTNNLAASTYAYGQRVDTAPELNTGKIVNRFTSDEIAFEYFQRDNSVSTDQVAISVWNDWVRPDSVRPPDVYYYDGKHHQGTTLLTGINRSQWHYLKSRWSHIAATSSVPDHFEVKLYAKQNPNDPYAELVGDQPQPQPNEVMAPHLNMWARGQFTGLTASASTNVDYYMDVDFYRVTQFALGNIGTTTSQLRDPNSNGNTFVPHEPIPDPVSAASAPAVSAPNS